MAATKKRVQIPFTKEACVTLLMANGRFLQGNCGSFKILGVRKLAEERGVPPKILASVLNASGYFSALPSGECQGEEDCWQARFNDGIVETIQQGLKAKDSPLKGLDKQRARRVLGFIR